VVTLLDQVAGQPPRRDHVDPLGRLTPLACDAAAWAITAGHPEQAVELLEHGRGVLLARSLDPASRDAASRDSGSRDAASRDAGSRDPPQAGPPLPFGTLREAAAGGPVVIINVSAYRCDALTVTPAGVQVTGLPALTAAEVSGRATDFVVALLRRHDKDPAKRAAARATLAQTLAWLWDTVLTPLKPVLEATATPAPGGTPPRGPARVWWCPTGPMTFLPLHAAARPGEPDHAVAASFVSSYAPTLSLLRVARAAAGPAAGHSGRPLVVALPASLGRGFRPGARQEGRAVARRLGGAVLLRGSRATAAAVTQRLAAGAPWAHFACRGTQNVGDPAAGRLVLYGGSLRAGEISGLGLAGAELAVLPACEAVLGGTRLADEAVTLAAAFGRAGYRHVIGTLWRPDGDVPVAEQVYAELGPPGGPAPDAAAALHRATEALRRAHSDEPWRWAPYIHIGP
ncbi:MAG TPA: CHAT domain-containing protein, partial [Streptosporangiaceae bacterium]|nr:CHAT domain-containing protein [Streptosporangiaceae bacterium]